MLLEVLCLRNHDGVGRAGGLRPANANFRELSSELTLAVFSENESEWLAVIGRALAFLSLHAADMRAKDIGEQAEFLQALGLSRDDMAPLIGSTPASIEVLLRKRRQAKGGKRGSKASKKAGGRGNS